MSLHSYSPSEWIDHLTNSITSANYNRKKEKIVAHMRALSERITSPEGRKKLIDIQVAVANVFEKAADDLSREGKQIRSLAEEIASKARIISEQQQLKIPTAAAQRGQASMAASRLKSMQAALAIFRKSPAGQLLEAEREQLKQHKAILEGLKKPVADDIEKKKAAEQAAKNANRPQTEIANLKIVRIQAQYVEIKLKKQLSELNDKIAELSDKIVLWQKAEVSLNPVILQKGHKFVMKVQSPELEHRVHLVCDELGVPDAIAPVRATTSHGAVEYLQAGVRDRLKINATLSQGIF